MFYCTFKTNIRIELDTMCSESYVIIATVTPRGRWTFEQSPAAGAHPPRCE